MGREVACDLPEPQQSRRAIVADSESAPPRKYPNYAATPALAWAGPCILDAAGRVC